MFDLCIDFTNSHWYVTHETYQEMLTDADLLRAFLEEHDLSVDMPPNTEISQRLFELRALLATSFEKIAAGETVSKEALQSINTYLAASSFRRIFNAKRGAYRISLLPLAKDWNWVMAEITASFAALLQQGDLSRVKLCENPECKWIFYDRTKNHTKRWCDETCANLMKVRRFRARRKQETTDNDHHLHGKQ